MAERVLLDEPTAAERYVAYSLQRLPDLLLSFLIQTY